MLRSEDARRRANQVRKELTVIGINQGGGSEYMCNTYVTCEYCGINDVCEFAFDLYNTDGDCLAEK